MACITDDQTEFPLARAGFNIEVTNAARQSDRVTSPWCTTTMATIATVVIIMTAQRDRSGYLTGGIRALAQLHQVADTSELRS